MIIGLFSDSDQAGKAVGELKEAGFTDDISIVTRDKSGEPKEEIVKEGGNIAEGAAAGAVTGGIVGLLVGAVSVAVPGIGALAVVGPLVAAWGVTGAAVGTLAGGIAGALVGLGVPQEVANRYANRIGQGDVLVAVSAPVDRNSDIQGIFAKYNANEVTVTKE